MVFERYADIGIPFEFRTTFKRSKGDIREIPDLDKRDCLLIIMIRDPFNLFASRCNQSYLGKHSKSEIIEVKDIWKTHAREFLGETNYFKYKVGINYNRWFCEKNYRKIISEQIGGRHSDRKINQMTHHGGGSSFIKKDKRYFKNAQKLDILNRWKLFIGEKSSKKSRRFASIFKDKELIELSQKIFGHIKGTEVLFE
tara:strand:- start:1303 stop:1896 length:594 start_codon:yes stop_codon:yes gene_type:complete